MADRRALWDGPVIPGRLVGALYALCSVFGCWAGCVDAGIESFGRLSFFSGADCAVFGRLPLNACIASPRTSRLAPNRTLRTRFQSKRSVVASTLTAGDAEQRRASSDACVPARLC